MIIYWRGFCEWFQTADGESQVMWSCAAIMALLAIAYAQELYLKNRKDTPNTKTEE